MKIVCLGDSLTRGFHIGRGENWPSLLNEMLPQVRILNRGTCGETSTEIISRLERDVLKWQPKIMIFIAGSNDVIFERSIENAKKNTRLAVLKSREAGILPILGTPMPTDQAHLWPQWLPKAKGAEINEMISQLRDWLLDFANEEKLTIVDLWKCLPDREADWEHFFVDGLHPCKAGNQKIAELFREALLPVLHHL